MKPLSNEYSDIYPKNNILYNNIIAIIIELHCENELNNSWNMNLRKEQVAGAGFGGPLLNIWKLEKKIRKFAENYRGHSYPLWNIGGSGPILIILVNILSWKIYKSWKVPFLIKFDCNKLISRKILFYNISLQYPPCKRVPERRVPLKPSGPALSGTSNIKRQLIYCNIDSNIMYYII